MKRMALKVALVKSDGPAYRLAQELDRSESYLSKLVSGLRNPSQKDAEKIAAYLGESVERLFPDMDFEKEAVSAP